MDVRLLGQFDEGPSDTVVDGRRRRRPRRALRVQSNQAAVVEAEVETPDAGGAGLRGDPGETLAGSPLMGVQVREAIVRRNHLIDRAASRPRQTSSTAGALNLVRVDWARARDKGLRVERPTPDTICVTGVATGALPACPVTSGRSASSVHRVPALSLGIDGLLFTEAVVPGRSALECVSGLCRKLEARFVLEVWSEDGAAFVRFIRPRALC